MVIRSILALLALACGSFSGGGLCAAEADGAGELVICIASKGQFANGQSADREGLRGLAELAHRYGFPVTYYLKPFAAAASRDELREWHRANGDEVGWFSEGTPLASAEAELSDLREIVDWAPVESTGNTKYGPEWVDLYRRGGIASVWGRCYEQTFVDGITDRGCPHGFYYAMRDCYKAPSPVDGGVISVPWLSNDLNLCFRTAWQPTFTFDPNDTQDLGVSTPDDATFWEAELDQYQAQVRLNCVVPLVIQQELSEFSALNPWKRDGAAILENLFKTIKRRGLRVVTVGAAVRRYRAAYPERTPPTYALFGNVGKLPIIRDCGHFRLSAERFTTGTGPTINGFYACNRTGDIRNYYQPQGIRFEDQPDVFTYYDRNGLLVFSRGDQRPIRITSYMGLPPNSYGEAILPEMSDWYDTRRHIPDADIERTPRPGGFHLHIHVNAHPNPVFAGSWLPYGVMLWGDHSGTVVPDNAPVGTKVIGNDGLFVPMILSSGDNDLDLDFTTKIQRQ